MSERILRAARKLVACVLKEREIKAQINWQACEHFEENEPDVGYVGREPCCFRKDESNDWGEDGNGMVHPDEWRMTCHINWRLRGDLGQQRKVRANYLRGLVNAVEADSRDNPTDTAARADRP